SHGNARPALVLGTTPTAVPVFEITAMAILTNGTQKMLQYVVAANPLSFSMPAALVLDGTNISFSLPSQPGFSVKGTDQIVVGSCNPGTAQVSAVGYSTAPNVIIAGAPDQSHDNILSAIYNRGTQSNYPGVPYGADAQGSSPPSPPPPSINYVG